MSTAGTPDPTTEVRDEDGFDVGAVHTWLRGVSDVPDQPPGVRQFPAGASNLTYLLRYPDRELVLRRPPAGRKAASAHDMAREHRVQEALRPSFGRVPPMVGLCEDPAVLGDTFYVMERVPGTVLRRPLPEGVELPPAEAGALVGRVFDVLADLHAVDVDAAGLAPLGRGPGYVRRQVEGWSRRYRDARTDDVPDGEQVMAWLDASQPPDVAAVLIHNDFRLDNVVLGDAREVVAVLDWEMATVGDPLMDLGGALAYWVQEDDDDVMRLAARQPSDLPGMPSREQLVTRYGARTGVAVDDWPFYEAFGLFRLMVIAQQIWWRYSAGQTTNPMFAQLGMFVAYLEWRCRSRVGLA